ncbi:hypothetical protein HMI54_007384 [Coelomomyces lativittatus]|nr:hypothetical protein HMI54_007384 [Coelomomyces lativittatus]
MARHLFRRTSSSLINLTTSFVLPLHSFLRIQTLSFHSSVGWSKSSWSSLSSTSSLRSTNGCFVNPRPPVSSSSSSSSSFFHVKSQKPFNYLCLAPHRRFFSSSSSSSSVELLDTSSDTCVSSSSSSSSSSKKVLLAFTCTVCTTRLTKSISHHSYTKGVVLVRCSGCHNLHLIADHLGRTLFNLSWMLFITFMFVCLFVCSSSS